MKKFDILAKVNGVCMHYTKFATCKSKAKKELLDDFYWTTNDTEVEILAVVEL